MWYVPITDVSIGDMFFIIDCLLGQVMGANVSCTSLHTPGSPQAGEEVRWEVPWKESPLPWPCFCCILQDNFLVNIFLRLKEDAITSSITWKTGTNQSVSPFTFKEDSHPKCLLGPKGHICDRHWARFTTPVILHGFAIIRKVYSSIDTTFDAE